MLEQEWGIVMKDLSLTQQYFLCVLTKGGKIPVMGLEKVLCLSASGVLELLLDQIVAYDGKKLTVLSELPEQKEYLRPVYEVVKRKQPVRFETVVEFFSVTLTSKHINELTEAIGDSLAECGCTDREQGGFFGARILYPPREQAVDAVVQSIRAELLEDGELSEDIVALTALLNKSGDLKQYFSAYEKESLKRRLREIRKNPQNEMIQKVSEYIDSLFLMFIVAAT